MRISGITGPNSPNFVYRLFPPGRNPLRRGIPHLSPVSDLDYRRRSYPRLCRVTYPVVSVCDPVGSRRDGTEAVPETRVSRKPIILLGFSGGSLPLVRSPDLPVENLRIAGLALLLPHELTSIRTLARKGRLNKSHTLFPATYPYFRRCASRRRSLTVGGYYVR